MLASITLARYEEIPRGSVPSDVGGVPATAAPSACARIVRASSACRWSSGQAEGRCGSGPNACVSCSCYGAPVLLDSPPWCRAETKYVYRSWPPRRACRYYHSMARDA